MSNCVAEKEEGVQTRSNSSIVEENTNNSLQSSSSAAATSTSDKPRRPMTILELEYHTVWRQFQELCTFDRISDPTTHFSTALAHMALNRYNNVLANESTLFPPIKEAPFNTSTSDAPLSNTLRSIASMSTATGGVSSPPNTAAGGGVEVPPPYLNANLIDSDQLFGIPLNLVAAQSPLPVGGQIGSWWAVIATYRIPLIVMLTKVQEGRRLKAHAYWPAGNAPGTTLSFENGYVVTLVSFNHNTQHNTCIRMLEVKGIALTGEPVCHIVEHVQYLGWPDFGVPQHFDDFQGVMDRLHFYANRQGQQGDSSLSASSFSQNKRSGEGGEDTGGRCGPLPTVMIHCSAGIGRTGTFLAAYTASVIRDRGTHVLSAEVLFEIVRRLKVCRTGMIQRPEQLHFLYRYLSLPVVPNSGTIV